ncbi:MAG: hypothetical protein C4K48_04405 [Candidatus Thorarchaeota archaeon]|nr:MAG: hypothetical protein C4K48_04405 [Candidatus Thorarchaeota archaeon]
MISANGKRFRFAPFMVVNLSYGDASLVQVILSAASAVLTCTSNDTSLIFLFIPTSFLSNITSYDIISLQATASIDDYVAA